MVSGCHRLGHDPRNALTAAGLTEKNLNQLDGRITAAQMERISDQLMRELDDEALGWFSRRLPWGSYGMLARASISSPTLEVAVKRWCRHHALLTNDVQLELGNVPALNARDSGTISLSEISVGPWLTNELREFCHVSLLRNLIGFASWLVDSRIPIYEADFAFPAPRHVSAYKILFPGTCNFSQKQTRVSFDKSYLQLTVCRNEAELQLMLKRALPLTVLSYRKDRLFISRVIFALKHQPETLKNAALLAATLNTSERTLHRQLKAEGTSLQALKDKVRYEISIDLLCKTALPLKKIALIVGFDNDKGFIRAFRRWTGLSPSRFISTKLREPEVCSSQ